MLAPVIGVWSKRGLVPIRLILCNATPEDICRFLTLKDGNGKTEIHEINCKYVGEKSNNCMCPVRLSAGRVQSILGKLSKLFESYGKGR